jgi:hypothetical protein
VSKLFSRNAASLVLVFLISFLFIYLTSPKGVKPYDEGIILTGAMRVAAGEVIHRDFYANYGPGQFYILAGLFKILGQKVLALRLLDTSIRAAIIVLVYFSTRPYAKEWTAIVLTVASALWLGFVGSKGYPVYPALLISIASTLIAIETITRRHSTAYSFLSGLLVGIVTLFRYDIGFLLLVAHTLSGALILRLEGRQEGFPSVVIRLALFYFLGVGLVGLTVAFIYVNAGILDSFIHDVVTFPGKYYAATRGLPFPNPIELSLLKGLSVIAIYLPAAAVFSILSALLGNGIYVFLRTPGVQVEYEENLHRNFLVFFIFLTTSFYLKGMVRVGIDQLQLSLIPAVMTLSAFHGLAEKRKHWIRFVLTAVVALTAVSAVSICLQIIVDLKGRLREHLQSSDKAPQSAGIKQPENPRLAPNFKVEPDRSLAIGYLMKHTKPGERIFVGVNGHDRIYENDVSAYFLTGRLPATKWHQFDPGLQTSAEIQSDMVAEFEVAKPRYIWLETSWNMVSEPNDSSKSSGVHILDGYINDNYEAVETFGAISILQRKCSTEDKACAPDAG